MMQLGCIQKGGENGRFNRKRRQKKEVSIEKREKKQENLTMKKREFYRESGRAGDSAQKRESPSKSGRLGTYVAHRNNYLSTPEYAGIHFAKIKPMAIINNY